MLTLTRKIYTSEENSIPTIGVFLDLSKTFDTADHPQILEALKGIGIRPNIYNLLESYLSNRIQCVRVGNQVSTKRIVQCGVLHKRVLDNACLLYF